LERRRIFAQCYIKARPKRIIKHVVKVEAALVPEETSELSRRPKMGKEKKKDKSVEEDQSLRGMVKIEAINWGGCTYFAPDQGIKEDFYQ